MDIHSAYYSNTGMYWGEWGPMSATSRGFWYGFKWFLYIIGTGFLVFVVLHWRKNKVNKQNIPIDEINEKNKDLSANQIKALSKKAKLVKCENCGYYPVEYGYICTKCGTMQSKGNQPEETEKEDKIVDPIKKKKNTKIVIFSLAGIVLVAVSIFVIQYIAEENERIEAVEKARTALIENAKKEQTEKDITAIKKFLGTYISEKEIGSDSESGFEIIENQGLFSVVPNNSDNIGRWLLIKFDEKSNSVFATKNGSKDTVKFADIINDYTLSISNKNYIKTSSNHYANLISENGKVVLDSIKTKTIKATNYLSYQKYKSGIDESNYYSISSDLINSSSNLKQQGNNSYGVENLADDYFSTAWVEGVDGNGIGERIEFSYGLTYDGGFTDSVLLIANGYQSTNAAFLNNSRVKQIKISHDKKLLYVVDLKDEMGLQKIVLTGISKYFQLYMKYGVNKSKNIQLQLEISDVFKGKKYEDTAITDIYFVSQNGQ